MAPNLYRPNGHIHYSILFFVCFSVSVFYILILFQLEEHESKNPLGVKNVSLNEFKRETNFHRQAQAAVLEGLARLKAIGVVTKRPEDYFAEMAKSDSHMQKVVIQYFLIVLCYDPITIYSYLLYTVLWRNKMVDTFVIVLIIIIFSFNFVCFLLNL